MLGAIIGDVIGSRFEMINYAGNKTLDNYLSFPLFDEKCKATDDSVLTCAVAHALMRSAAEKTDPVFADMYKTYGRKHPLAGYGSGFMQWLDAEGYPEAMSYGNGAAMRVSPIGWFYDSLDEVLRIAELSAKPTHFHPEAVKGAQAIASGVFLARTGKDKETIKNYIEGKFGYDLDKTLDEIRPTYEFSSLSQDTVPPAIRAFLEGNSYENVIRMAISIGGDSDTIADMAGALAHAMYGIPEQICEDALEIVNRKTPDLYEVIEDFCAEYL